jgi:DNA-binding HxlR family transcriptional regulator
MARRSEESALALSPTASPAAVSGVTSSFGRRLNSARPRALYRNVSRPLLTTGTPLSPALELIFARWTPHIVWLLAENGPMRFGDLQRRLSPVGTAMLAQRLRQMEAAGFLERRLYMHHPPRVEYSLTERGRSLMPLLRAVEDWSATHLKEEEAR